ncbi:phenylalanyl-tRNA synthetase subunit alpha [uncultured bacterium]|uniref:Putative tRNA synthetase n=1 Tax=uncultured microorganism TaxID=358574 RepID=A0A077JGG1_9ZZZZ|nr:putative tRNA synthetase [uncultured microorganism]BCL65666.1 phenylalanyl-tRNA synthetase subunit alpha [uncultured bacterium]
MRQHPVYRTIDSFLNFFSKYNFIHHLSNIITTYEDNFYFLECDDNHIALSNKDTFLLKDNYILRTHTTSFQKSVLNKYKLSINNNVNLNALNYGVVFRKDDSSKHSYFFHQIDGIMCNYSDNINDYIIFLITSIKYVLFNHKNIQVRIRSSYFPFTYPSFEIDIIINNEIIEILGCGFIKQSILNKCSINKKNIFAFGLGIERIASINFNIPNIKKLRLS